MFRALLWKEWRQLALVRWGGIALGALLPVAFMAGGELARRGLLPAGSATRYTPRNLMFELLPAALAMGVWPLIALMSAAQSFAGDRAAGNEPFLLERPVPPSSVWGARLLGSFGTLCAVVVATGAVAASAAALTGAPPNIGWSRWAILASLGIAIALLAYAGGLTAASLLVSPLGAVLAGALLGAVPAVLAAELSFFVFARIGAVYLGAALPALLLPAYLTASWLAFCRGEPAGRGRLRRALTLLGSSLAGVLVLFAGLAPVVVRANAAGGAHTVAPSPSGRFAFVQSTSAGWGGGWIVDTASGSKRVFVPPPVSDFAWSPDGSQLALLTWSGPLGSERPHERLDVLAADDGRLVRTIPLADEISLRSLAWAEGGLAGVVLSLDRSDKKKYFEEVEIIDPVTGVMRETGFRSDAGYSMRVTARPGEPQAMVLVMVEREFGEPKDAPYEYRLHPLDVAAARVGPPIADADGHPLAFSGWGSRSPSGRFAKVGGRVLDLRGDAGPTNVLAPTRALWVAGDRLVWHEDLGHRTRMVVAIPGSEPKPLREWQDAQVGLQPSPDGRAVFVSVIPAGGPPQVDARRPPGPSLFEAGAPRGVAPEELVYLADEDRFVTLGRPFSDRANDRRYSLWAGPKTLARIAPGVVYFEDLDRPGVLRFVIGGARDLE